MALETATYINQLVPSNPAGTDQIAQGDDHIRMLKAVLQATFPNITGPITKTQAELNATGFSMPIGIITAWYGSDATVPSGWAICNGQTVARTDGGGNITTPDLRDRAVVGAGTLAAQGATTGSNTASANTGAAGSHTHTITGGSHSHSASAASTTAGGTINTQKVFVDQDANFPECLTSATFSGTPHTHSISVDSASHSHTASSEGSHQHSVQVSTVQPVMGLHFIMKV